jgi:hypothetical protein
VSHVASGPIDAAGQRVHATRDPTTARSRGVSTTLTRVGVHLKSRHAPPRIRGCAAPRAHRHVLGWPREQSWLQRALGALVVPDPNHRSLGRSSIHMAAHSQPPPDDPELAPAGVSQRARRADRCTPTGRLPSSAGECCSGREPELMANCCLLVERHGEPAQLRSALQTEHRPALETCGARRCAPASTETRYFMNVFVGDRRRDVTLGHRWRGGGRADRRVTDLH